MTQTPENNDHDFAELRVEAARLPVLRPSHDLWDGIAARIDAPPIALADRREVRPAWLAPSRLAAAAALLVAVTAGVTWQVASHAAAPATTVAATAPTDGAVDADATGSATSVVRLTGAYDQEIAELRAILALSTLPLDSSTVAIVDENLRVIDEAIAAARAALAADPASALLSQRLAGAYDMKLDLLRRLAAMSAIS
jgi:hypothetical protein